MGGYFFSKENDRLTYQLVVLPPHTFPENIEIHNLQVVFASLYLDVGTVMFDKDHLLYFCML